MTEFVVSAKLTADATALKSGAGEGKAALDDLKRSAETANTSTRKFGEASRQTADGLNKVRGGATGLADGMVGLQRATAPATAAQRALNGVVGQGAAAFGATRLSSAAFAGFIGGPLGVAIGLGIAALGGLIANLFSSKKATEGLTEAQKIQRLGLKELSEAIAESDKAMKKSLETSREAELAAYDKARAHASAVIEIRKETKAALELALANIELADSSAALQSGEEGKFARQVAVQQRGRAAGLQNELRAATEELRKAEEAHRRAAIPALRRQSQGRTDPAFAITEQFEKRMSELAGQFAAGTISLQAHNRELDKARNLRERDTKALQDANRTPRATRDPTLPKVGAGDVSALLRDAFGGGAVTRTLSSPAANKRAGGVANSYHLSGQAVDFVPKGGMGSLGQNWREDIRAAAAAVGIKVLELLGPGDKGHSDHLHLAFAKQRLGPDQVAAQASRATEQAARLEEQRQRKADQLASFGTNAGQAIANVSGRFGEASGRAEQARAAMSELDQLLAEIEKRKPPNFAALLQQGREAKGVIEEGITQPYRDFIEDQEFQLQQQRLIIAGREEEAEVIAIIRNLTKEQGTLTAEQQAAQLQGVRAIVSANRAAQREGEIAREKQEMYLDAVRSTRDAVRGIFDFSGQGLKELPKRLFATFEKLAGDVLFEKIFGKFFRQIEEQIKGSGPLEVFDERVVTANTRLDAFEKALQGATTTLNGAGSDPLAPLASGGGDSLGAVLAAISGGGGGGSVTGGANGTDIVVTAKRSVKVAIPGLSDKFGDILKGMGGAAVGMAANVIQQMFGGVGQMAGKVKGGKISDMLGGLAQTAAQYFPPLALGMGITSGLSKVLGVKNFAGGAFGIVGNVIAGALGFGKKKVDKGSTTITSVDGKGRSYGDSKKATSSAASNVQDALRNIADQLGGGLGAFNVSIGQRDGQWRVDPTGRGKTKKSKGAKDFDDDQGAAIAFAIADAIKDGAITGLSAAVQKALKSSTNLDKALAEATKTAEVELLIKGLGGQLEKQFRDFENVAKDRVRIAKAYGLDLVKLEKINGEERAKVFNDILQSRIGSLKELLDDLNFGDLFEGSMLDRLAKLRGELNRAATDAAAGVEGAGDRQAQLSRDLVGLSREAYGTAGGEFAADLAAARTGAERTIQLESERVRVAAEAARQTNAHLNENNNQNAQMITRLDRGNALLEMIANRFGSTTGGGGYTVRRNPVFAREGL